MSAYVSQLGREIETMQRVSQKPVRCMLRIILNIFKPHRNRFFRQTNGRPCKQSLTDYSLLACANERHREWKKTRRMWGFCHRQKKAPPPVDCCFGTRLHRCQNVCIGFVRNDATICTSIARRKGIRAFLLHAWLYQRACYN
jgi:hypothetical protein